MSAVSFNQKSCCINSCTFTLGFALTITLFVCGILGLTGDLDVPIWAGGLMTGLGSLGIINTIKSMILTLRNK